jgi:hypothetical protein
MNKITYTVEDEPIVLSKYLMDTLLGQPNSGNLIALYCFYYYTAKWQKTNTPKATIEYVANGLGIGVHSVHKYKNQLMELNLIENISTKNEKGAITGHFIKVNFLWNRETVRNLDVKEENNPKNGTISHTVGKPILRETHTVENSQSNALSTNKESIYGQIFKNEKIKPDQFLEFYKRYPRKVKKGSAKKAWDNLCKRKEDCPTWKEIRTAIAEQIDSELWTEKPEMIAHPATWLNNNGWMNKASDLIVYKQKVKDTKVPFPLPFGQPREKYPNGTGIRYTWDEQTGCYRHKNGDKLVE